MQNLGYWQLKGRPGIWSLRLAEGKASELFDITVPVETLQATSVSPLSPRRGAGSGSGNSGGYTWWGFGRRGQSEEAVVPSLDVVVRDFTGPITQLTVRKKPGMEKVALLDSISAEHGTEGGSDDATPTPTSLWSSMSRHLFGNKDNATALTAEKPLIHVFSLASGHLYERFLKIMMVSVTKRTTSANLKFWLVENFLSPQVRSTLCASIYFTILYSVQFKESVPALMEKYGFQVGYVTYKWPNWLRAQTEKQRIIWGYKILFLDVLFPLNVTKVIYVDSDQVVRADLKELWDMDLQVLCFYPKAAR
jgi:UDP-glucose:glycoprotein glucosyltransferase